MFTRPEGRRFVRLGSLRLAFALGSVGILAAFTACVRQPAAAAPAPAERAPADTAMMLAYHCVHSAVTGAGLIVTEADSRRYRLEARSSLAAPGQGAPTSSGPPVDMVTISVRPATADAADARPVIHVNAETLQPRYVAPSNERPSAGVIWTQVMLSSRAIAARRAVLDKCSGDTASRLRAGA